MIKSDTYARIIQDGLNNNAFGIKFRLFTDAGKYKRAMKTRTEKTRYTNGLLSFGTSAIVPTTGVTIATQGASLEICVQLLDEQTDEQIVAQYRNIFDTYFQAFTVQPIDGVEFDADGKEVTKTYTVSAVYSLANTGTVELRDGVGTSITFRIDIDYGYIENGLNSYNVRFTLDGYPLDYTSAKITKSPATQGDSFSDSGGKGESINVSFLRSFDFQIPATTTAFGNIIMSQVLDDGLNTPHTLVMTYGSVTKTYNVIFGAVDMSLEGVNNAGHSISLTERAF